MNARIDIKNASVSYFLRKAGISRKATEQGAVGAQILVAKRYFEVAALRDVSLSLRDGDRVGLVGINGSGKSTLLKLCAGALTAQKGTVDIAGRVSPQFSLGSGIKTDLSGRRNAELKCLYMGVPQSSIPQYVEEVKALSGLGGYFELPIKSYSAGMRSRLVMSFLRLVRGDILIMDEWINVADPSLNSTVGGLQSRLIDRSKILVLASHSRRVLADWVDTLVWLDKGRIRAHGPIEDVHAQYEVWMDRRKKGETADNSEGPGDD